MIQWPLLSVTIFLPLVGAFIGFIEVSILLILSQLGFTWESLAVIAIAINLWITGGLHHDGLIDTADGIAAGKARCLEAMKDSRVGASGVIALIIIITIKIAALFSLNSYYLLTIPIAYFWGRYSHLIAIGNYPYLSKNGESRFHKSNWNGNIIESIPSIIFIILVILIILGLNISYDLKIYFLISNTICLILSLIIPKLLSNKLGGHCGDSYGASIVLVETFALFLMVIIVS